MLSRGLFSLSLLAVAALLGSGGSPTVDGAAVTTVASTTPSSTAAPARGLTISRWRLTQGNAVDRPPADGKVEPRLVQTAPLPEVGLGVSGVGDVLAGTKLAMAQKLLEHPLIAKILRPIMDLVTGSSVGGDGPGELLNPSYFGSSFSFPFAFRSNFFKSGNATDEAVYTKASHPHTDSSDKEATSGDSTEIRDAKAVRSGGAVQHYRLAVAKSGRPSAPMPAPKQNTIQPTT